MKSGVLAVVVVLGGAMVARAQEAKEGDSELYKRALESLKNIQRDKPAPSGDPGPTRPAPPASPPRPNDSSNAPKSTSALPPAPSPAPAPKAQNRLPGFSEVAPTPPPPKPKVPARTELPKPPPTVIRIDPSAPRTAPTGTNPQSSSYTIQPGDTFSLIAHKLYGDEGRWIAIAKANPLVDPVHLKVGQVIRLPDLANIDKQRAQEFEALREEVSQPSGSTQSVTVEPGDNLSTIAQRVYGRASLWRTIFDANKDQLQSPDELKVGMKLKIPPRGQGGPRPAAPTTPPGSPGTRG